MADKGLLISSKGRDLLSYTRRATRIVTDDISIKDARVLFQRLAALEDIRDVRSVCSGIVEKLDKKKRDGFTKSEYRLFGEDMRMIAKDIVRDIQAANNINFEEDHDLRIRRIDALLDDCAMLLEYVRICLDEKIISAAKAATWTSKIMEVKRMAGSWRKKDGGRAATLREAEERREDERLLEVVRKGVRCELGIPPVEGEGTRGTVDDAARDSPGP